MNNKFIKNLLLAGVLTMTSVACDHSLDITPENEVVSAKVYKDFSNYKMILAKLYAGYAVTGQRGPAGSPDIGGIDEGFSNYLRQYWQAQELTTDEAIIAWNDGNLRDLHDMDWTPGNEFLRALYDRIFYQVSLTNEFIRETTDEKLSERGITGTDLAEAKKFRAEARFLRALSYWHAIDLYGNVPFVTEADKVGFFFPKQATRAELFTYIESELKAIENDLVAARQNEYGRADKAAAWTLLAKLYLNANVYTGQPKFTEAITYAKKVIDAGYSLESDYDHLFLTDNFKSKEIIFPITFDGLKTNTWGGMTYLVHAPVGGSMNARADFGINGGWYGLRTTKAFVGLFNDISGNTDDRANFHTAGQELEINDIFTFTDGYAIAKFKNLSSTGQVGSDPENHPDTDFPMFRLGDVYLMYAEAALRANSSSDITLALQYVNQLRARAFMGSTSGAITTSQFNLDFILNERGRELYWEGHRRTDLIRFNRYTTDNYIWPWKGGVKQGRAVEPFRTLFPIPSTDLTANPNLKQNTGY
jgi:starch-binding outer membrane protein, SusD/RagB family